MQRRAGAGEQVTFDRARIPSVSWTPTQCCSSPRCRSAGIIEAEGHPEADVGYHTPCHLRALGNGSPFSRLLERIPSLRVRAIEEG